MPIFRLPAFAAPVPSIFASSTRSPTSACTRRPTARAPTLISTRATLTPDPDAASSSPPEMTVSAVEASSSVEELSINDQKRVSAVRTQMEFWFSASNLRRDWYLRRQMDPDGWLDPSIFLLFNRIKTLHADLSDIITACRQSDELEVSTPNVASFGDEAGQTRVRRNPELPDFRNDDDHELSRSFILKGIPLDSTVDSLQALFEPIAHVVYVRIYRNKNFPTSPRALICFEDDTTANTVFELFRNDPPAGTEGIVLRRRQDAPGQTGRETSAVSSPDSRPSLLVCKITDLPLELDWKTLHREIDSVFSEATGTGIRYLMFYTNNTHCHITVASNEASRALIESLSESGIMIRGSKVVLRLLTDDEELKTYWRAAAEHQATRLARRAERNAIGSDMQRRYPTGVIVKVTGLPEDAAWRQIKADLRRLGKLIYLNHERNATFCYARFGSPEEASEVRDALVDFGELVCGESVQASLLQGQEEEDYWTRAREARELRNKNTEGDNE